MGRAEVVYKLPVLLNCTGKEYEDWRVTVEKKNLREYKSAANGLVIVKRECIARESFWWVKTQDKRLSYVELSRETAERLLKEKGCLDANGKISSNLGRDDYECHWGWMEKKTTDVISCKHYEGNMYAKHDHGAKTDLTGFRGCEYKEGYCRALDGMYLKWEVIPEVAVEYMEVGEFDALKINGHLLIEKLGLVLEIGDDENATTWVDREFRVTKVRGDIRWDPIGIVNMSDDSVEALRNEMNSRIQYLEELIKSPKAQASYLCEVWNRIRLLERMLAAVDPTTYIRVKTNNSLVTGRKAGNFVFAYPCVKVNKLKWIREDAGKKCHDGMPVSFVIEGSDKVHKGFLMPKHNKIEIRGVEVDCHKREPEVTEVNGKIEWHTAFGNEIHSVNLSDVVDLTYNLDKGIGMIDFMQTDWVYDSEELRDTEIDRLVREEDDMRADSESGSSSGRTEIDSMWNFLGIFNERISTILGAAVMWVERIVVVIIAWKIFKCNKSSCLRNERGVRFVRWARENASEEGMRSIPEVGDEMEC
jgi:hypothetical protein